VGVSWTTVGNKRYALQATAGGGASLTSGFKDISGVITMPSGGEGLTNFVDVGGASNGARFYRVRLITPVVFREDFESANLGNWSNAGAATSLSISTTTNQTPNGAYSAAVSTSLNRMYHNLGLEMEGHVKVTFWIYDNNGPQNRVYGEVRSYSGAGFTNGSLQQLFAIGRYGVGFGTANGTAVQQWACGNAQVNQEWQFQPTDSGFFKVVNRNAPAEVWDVTNVGTTNGSLIQLWQFGGGTNQQWQPVSLGNGTFKFVGRGSSRCLDVPGASTSNGARLQIFDCNGTGAQAWTLKQQP